jgi:DNA-binding Lrp family transcriptional regulator
MMEQLIGMSTTYILINCEAGTQQETIGKLNKLSGVVEVSEVNGIYDLVVRVYSDAVENMKQTITRHIRTINTIRSTMTLIVIE